MDYTLDIGAVTRNLGPLVERLWVTLQLTIAANIIGVTAGFGLALLVGALLVGSRLAVLRLPAMLFVEFFRCTPVLIQLFWIFFCLPLLLGVELSNLISATIALTLYMGAITSETFRAALRAVGAEQMDACVALGLPKAAQVLHVILPQAVLRAAPTLLSNCISLFKESALVSAVGMADLMFVGQNISNNTARPIEVLTAVACIYFVIAFPLTRLVTRIERRMLRKLAA